MSQAGNGTAKRIVVGVDGSPASSAALRWAVSEAELTGDIVLAVIAWQYPIAAGGYGWAPVAMDDGIDLEAIAEKTLAQAIDEVVRPGSAVTIELVIKRSRSDGRKRMRRCYRHARSRRQSQP